LFSVPCAALPALWARAPAGVAAAAAASSAIANLLGISMNLP